ncbi:polygalacturonase QRT3 [Citrus sinensis]|uniref:polygalacturonase QRT3-like isoform X1 n=1 Tax=Citrus sinensis TaxID=2711 RepID=UPI00219125AC|nr:polygalacturonase QRT3-like isoform X1 [Citrus sinensis]KAH9662110.1 polygalacturonase QRT3 [Citrus sinensis]
MVGRNALLLGFLHVILVIIQYAESSYPYPDGTGNRDLSIKASHFLRSNGVPPINALQAALTGRRSRIHHVTDYGADPTGRSDSTDALEQAIVDAFTSPVDGHLNEGVPNLGGSEVHLDGGTYMISRPLRLSDISGGNFMIHGGSLRASDDFSGNGHLIELRSSSSSPLYEYITLKELMLDSNFRGGGIAIINSIRTTVDNCYISHFTTTGISIQDGHETYIRNSFIGQHINIGGDDREKDFSGIGINITGNDNAVTDVVIFSASIGVMVQGQANMLTGIHCYNKATALGGTGIYIRAPGLTQTRVVNCYLDFTGIVAEDPVQLHVTGSFFLGNAFILLKSVKGVASGVNIVDNMFAGDYTGVPIVKLDQSNAPFKTVDQVVIDRNNVRGMVVKSTVARGSLWKNGTTWTLDFSKVLLFPNLIPHVHYALHAGSASSFPRHILRSVSRNRVTVQTDVVVSATVHVSVDQTTVGGHI